MKNIKIWIYFLFIFQLCHLQSSSLKDVVLITKELLSIRNKEVEHLHEDIKSMEEKINAERERHNNMLNRMSEAVKCVYIFSIYRE